MNPFDTLGLSPDADDRAIRRAYAQRLKQHRPDEDPVGFQRITEAYQACLAWRREEEAELPQPDPVDTAPSLANDDDDAANEDPVYFDLEQFLEALFEQVDAASPKEVSSWLYSRPELYSFRLKSALAPEVLTRLASRVPAAPARTLDAVAAFFGADSLGPSGWWLTERLEKARARAELRDRFRRVPLPRRGLRDAPKDFDLVIDREVAFPDSLPRRLAVLFMPGGPTRVRDRIVDMDVITEGLAEEFIDPARRKLYFELADRSQVSWRRMALSLARSGVFGALLMLVFGALGTPHADIARFVGVLAAAWIVWQLCMAAARQAYRWLTSHVEPSLVRELSTLAVLGAGLALVSYPGLSRNLDALGYVLLGLATVLAVTPKRTNHGVCLVFILLVPDLLLGGALGEKWPFRAVALALAVAPLSVLALDRFVAWRRKVPVSVAETEREPLSRLLAAATILAGLSIVAAGAIVTAEH